MVEYSTISNWQEAAAKLKHYKKVEAELRRNICETLFDGRTGKFTITEDFAFDDYIISVKATSVTNLNVDEQMLLQLYENRLLTEEDNECFERKVHIKDSKLRKRPSDSNVWKAITEKPGMPKLEVKQDAN